MKTDFQNCLEEGEEIKWSGEPNRGAVYTTFSIIYIVILAFGYFIFFTKGGIMPHGIIPVIIVYAVFALTPILFLISTLKSSYAITDRRVLIKRPFGDTLRSFPLEKIEGKKISKGPVSFMFKCGTLKLDIGEKEMVTSTHGGIGAGGGISMGGFSVGGRHNTHTRIKWYGLHYIKDPEQALRIVISESPKNNRSETG